MRRLGITGVYLFALAVWAQLLAPAAVARMAPAFDPFTIICTHQPADDGSQPVHHAPAHHCCVLCHAYLGAAPLDGRPAFTILDYPVSSPLRWRVVAHATSPLERGIGHRPRDPPSLI